MPTKILLLGGGGSGFFIRGGWKCELYFMGAGIFLGIFFFYPTICQKMRTKILAWPVCKHVSGIFVVQILEDFAGHFPGGLFLEIFPQK